MIKIEHKINIHSDAATVYQALTTYEGLTSWHSAHITGGFNLNDQFSVHHENKPSLSWQIINLNPPHHVTWQCVVGPGSAPGTTASFDIIPDKDGTVWVECIHQGWLHPNSHLTECNTLWGMLLTHLKEFLEKGKAEPTFN